MTWTSPFTAVTGAVITAAGWNASGRDNLNHLRALIGDPGAADRVPLSSSTSAASWQQVSSAAIADLAVTNAKLATNAVSTSQVVDHSLTAVKVHAIDAPADNEVLSYDVGTGFFEWQAVSALATSVPTGLIAGFKTAAAIASGWARCDGAGGRPGMDGRVPVGAGTTFTVTYTEDTQYGAAWSHTHTDSGHDHSGSSLGISGTTGNNNASGQSAGTGTTRADSPHGHDQGSLDVTGNTASGTATVDSTSWVIPSYALVWAIKT